VNEAFPDATFMTIALRNYWEYVHPSFPFVHKPTFSSREQPLLTLAMVALGAVYMGHRQARTTASDLYRRVKSRMISIAPEQLAQPHSLAASLAQVQVGVMGQLFGLLHGAMILLPFFVDNF
jgi:hypothetical protein